MIAAIVLKFMEVKLAFSMVHYNLEIMVKNVQLVLFTDDLSWQFI